MHKLYDNLDKYFETFPQIQFNRVPLSPLISPMYKLVRGQAQAEQVLHHQQYTLAR